MSASVAPREPWRAFLARTASSARLVAVMLGTVVSVRFAIAGFEHALGEGGTNVPDRPAAQKDVPGARPGASLSRARTTGSGRAAPPAPPPDGRPMSVTLGFTHGAPRSELYVNGRRVGQTPFFGDVSCKAGFPLKIELVPPSGPPIAYERQCLGGTLEISTPPP